jgi:hypothetical protein
MLPNICCQASTRALPPGSSETGLLLLMHTWHQLTVIAGGDSMWLSMWWRFKVTRFKWNISWTSHWTRLVSLKNVQESGVNNRKVRKWMEMVWNGTVDPGVSDDPWSLGAQLTQNLIPKAMSPLLVVCSPFRSMLTRQGLVDTWWDPYAARFEGLLRRIMKHSHRSW